MLQLYMVNVWLGAEPFISIGWSKVISAMKLVYLENDVKIGMVHKLIAWLQFL